MSPPLERSWAKEAPRDQHETAFTPILRRLLLRTTGLLAVTFVDGEGETVDYCSSLPPFDAKVAGAHWLVVVSDLARRVKNLGAGESWMLHVHAHERDILARRVSDEYLLVVILKARGVTRKLLGGVELTVQELRREASIDVPPWEPAVDSVRVSTREAVGWAYAPDSFVDDDGSVVVIDDVLGRWIEGSGRHGRVCFRVRTADGEELTLVHVRASDRWERLRDRDSIRPGER